MYRKIHIMILFCIGLFLAGCEESGQSSDSEAVQESKNKTVEVRSDTVTLTEERNEKPRIALVIKTLSNPFFLSMEEGAKRAAKDLNIDLVIKSARQETSASQQVKIVNNLIDEGKIQAIVISPADSIRLIPVLKKAQNSGIFIVNVDNRLDVESAQKAGASNIPFVSIDNEESAYLAAQYLSQQIKEPAEAAILEGIREAENAGKRLNGAKRAFGENPNLKVVASETAHWKIDEAYQQTQGIFEKFPDVSVIFAANDMMALGAIAYLKEVGKTDVKVSGFDAIPDARAAISQGDLYVTVDQLPSEQGYLGIKVALDMINGVDVDSVTTLSAKLVSKNNE